MKKKIKFTKMHGLGNDFVVIDGREINIASLRRRTRLLADRRLGIGCDQVLVLRKSRKADFRMQIFNADGSEVEMCGNGIRCLARYLHEGKITSRKEVRFETLGGIIITKMNGREVGVDMGVPVLDAWKIPVDLSGRVRNHPVKVGGRLFKITCLSMGNPHCVIFVNSVDSLNVSKYGPLLENHVLFPNRINVEFVEVVSNARLKMRVWERGAGETLACGTGACASVVAARLTQKTGERVSVGLQGGSLKIHWRGEGSPVFMRGPASVVFTGVVEI